MFAAAAALARRRALAALAQPQVAQARGMAIVRRSGRAAAADSKAVAPLAPTWQPVKDKETGLTYYWNERTGQTTAVGAPRPEGEFLPANTPQFPPAPASSFGRTMVELVAYGAGISFAFAAVRAIIG